MNIYTLLIGAVIGFLLAKFIAGKDSSHPNVLRLNLGSYVFNLQLWLLALLMIIFFVFYGFYNDLLFGFLLGIIIQGITYNGFYEILVKKA